ncbi:very long chain fatty acid elongase 7-like [Arctopsyche grandis]|uniref:very long chain fatty acid elongase 7-like n=1 Tax=Arctopsyche grandis TaxID=121162 RepID=UPI00406DA092
MTQLLKNILDTYRYIDYDLADPRTREYGIMLNPIFLLGLMVVYYRFSYYWGPKFMKNRDPFNLNKLMICYNISQIIFCTYVAYRSIYLVWWPGEFNSSIWCIAANYDDTPEEREKIFLGMQYHYLKIYDFVDTIFFVLRKKNNQITFLHVYHHTGMIIPGFLAMKYATLGHGVSVITLNCIVHSIMYFYYLLTSINSDYKKSVWLKKKITQIQMIQFIIFIVYFTLPVLIPQCMYPNWACLLFVPQNVYMLVMFADFYMKTYLKKNQ